MLALPVRKARRYRQAENRLQVVRAQGTGRIDRKENQDVGRIVVKEKKAGEIPPLFLSRIFCEGLLGFP